MCCAFSASLNVCIHRTFLSKSLKGHIVTGVEFHCFRITVSMSILRRRGRFDSSGD